MTSWKGKSDLFFTIIMRDISERRTAEEQLDRLHYHNQVVLNSAGEGIYGVDREGRLTFVNPAAAKMFGWEVESMIGRSLHALVFPPDLCDRQFGELKCPIVETIRGGEIREQVDSAFWRKDGTSFPVEYVSTPISERGILPARSSCLKIRRIENARKRNCKTLFAGCGSSRGGWRAFVRKSAGALRGSYTTNWESA